MVCSSAFVTLGRAQLKALGHAAQPMAVMPHPFGARTRAEVRALAATLVDEIARLALGEGGPAAPAPDAADAGAGVAAVAMPADIVDFNAAGESRRWSDGLPLIPPTRARVAQMLAATARAPSAVVARLAPGFGAASVERIAVNAVMAGLAPPLLPVLLAAVEAVAEPPFNLQGVQATTNSATPWLIVSGPLAGALGINAGINCLGQGARANATLGRALRLVLQNVGRALPGEMDRATHGQPGKYTFCCAENGAANPWQPLAVERGFAAGDSVVTAVAAAGTLNLNSHSKDAAELLRVLATSIAYPTSNDYHFAGEPWLVLSPEHAAVLAAGGLGPAGIRRGLWEQSRLPAGRMADKDFVRLQNARGAELGAIGKDTLVPVAPRAEDIGLVVAGGPGTHSVYVPTFGQTRAVSKRIAA